MELKGEGKICSFCGSTWSLDNRFAGGFGAQICRDCVTRYAEILGNPAELRARSQRGPWETMSDEELLETLPHIVATADQVSEFLHDWVDLLRERGVSWQQIGLALGVSRQAAWERFTRVRKSLTPRAEQG